MKPLLDGFALMAADQNEKHEENEDSAFGHPHGWGIIFQEKRQLKIFKSILPCFEDPSLRDFESLNSPLVVLHARRASIGEVVLKNVHPFSHEVNGETAAFCHNGTIYQSLPTKPEFQPQGATDSELFFGYLLAQMIPNALPESLLCATNAIQDYSSLNSVFCQPNRVLVLNKFSRNPLYYTMKMARQNGTTLVSSEVLPTLPDWPWQKLTNGALLDFQLVANNWMTQRY
jgi:predicted glutamine amidotransferase